ncbi:MAG: hypothetical protein ACRDOI_11100 [Trebonia sp.]
MDLDHFTAILADLLAEIAPTGFHVAAADGMLCYSAEHGRFPGQRGDYNVGQSGTHVRGNFGAYGASDEENIIGVAVQALDELQDYISEATHEPWPGVTSQPSPHGHIHDSYLDLWYGDLDNPVLTCARIPLTQVGYRPGCGKS